MTANANIAANPPDPLWLRTLQAIDRLNRLRQAAVPDLLTRVREVVVIASSSRGGSSIFTEILRQSPELIHFKGEINPLLAIAGLTYPASGRADDGLEAADAGPGNRQKLVVLEREMALDVGIKAPHSLATDVLRQRFMADLLFRVTIQWPEIEIDQGFVYDCIEQTFAELGRVHGWQPNEFNDPPLFHVLFLARLRTRYPGINPHYYDLAPELIKRFCPEAEIDLGPPAGLLIEEPPFVLIAPRHPVSLELLARQPLIIKTPSNAYRLAFLKALFPEARFRILHLVRSPADSINGLVDGWLYHGFFSHRLPARLAIKGYSDRFPEWGGHWWNYDLPPGWQQWTDQPLEQVCGYQWRHAHQAVLDFIAHHQVECLRVAFEEVLGDLPVRRQRFGEIADWLGIDPEPLITAATGDLPPVMATVRPVTAGNHFPSPPCGPVNLVQESPPPLTGLCSVPLKGVSDKIPAGFGRGGGWGVGEGKNCRPSGTFPPTLTLPPSSGDLTEPRQGGGDASKSPLKDTRQSAPQGGTENSPCPTSAGTKQSTPQGGTENSPRQRRWFKKAALLLPVLATPSIIKTAKQLGYDSNYDDIPE